MRVKQVKPGLWWKNKRYVYRLSHEVSLHFYLGALFQGHDKGGRPRGRSEPVEGI